MTVLMVTLASTVAAIWIEKPTAAQFLDLTKALLSWKVILGGLAAGGTVTFKGEIRHLLQRLAHKTPV